MAAVMEQKSFRGLRELFFLLFLLAAAFVLTTLISFNHDDGGWTRSGFSEHPRNAGGIIGAWFSDIAFSLFGFVAYIIPFIILWQGYLFYTHGKRKTNIFIAGLRWLGVFATVVAGSSIFYLHIPRLKIELPSGSGGILGQEAGDALLFLLGEAGANLVVFGGLILGLSFFSGFSLFILVDLLGKITLFLLERPVKLLWLILKIKTNKSKPDTDEKKSAKPKSAKNQTIQDALLTGKFGTNKANRKKDNIPPTAIVYKAALPELSLLDSRNSKVKSYSKTDLDKIAILVETVLQDFNVSATVVDILPGPVVTRFELLLAPGVKVSRVSGLSKDLARGLSVTRVRVVEVIQGKSVIGLEIPNREREIVSLSDLLASENFTNSPSNLTLAIGKDIAGQPIVADLAKMPHLLVAGTTGSGKSVAINTMILSMLYKASPEQVRMIMIDPKMLELSVYEAIPHLLTPVVTDMKEASNALRWAVGEMERRYKLMSKLGVRNIDGFNQKVKEASAQGKSIPDPLFKPDNDDLSEQPPPLTTLPNIVILIDELADMMMIVGKKVEELIARLAQKARASGIHLILATQRPSVDVLTGLIKANIPTRISFQVSSRIDSRTILDQGGAESLLGNGDMLFLPPGTSIPIRAHGAFVDDQEVHRVVSFLKGIAPPNYVDEILQDHTDIIPGLSAANNNGAETDALYDQAVAFVLDTRKASISSVQRKFKIGYNRAARMIEEMEAAGIVSAAEENGARKVLATAIED